MDKQLIAEMILFLAKDSNEPEVKVSLKKLEAQYPSKYEDFMQLNILDIIGAISVRNLIEINEVLKDMKE